jgi:prolipoprotein diacylglyceryltransferase
MNRYVIETGNTGVWFTVVYLITIFLVTTIFCIQGIRQHRSFITMWFITVSGMLFFLIGIHLFPLTPEELKTVLFTRSRINQGEKSVLGGLLVIAGLWIAILWLKEKIALIDNLTVPFLIGVGLQNIGCLMAGCCYGNPANLPWSIHYGTGSPAYMAELQNGLIHTGETATLAIHPVQLYLLIVCLLIAFITWKFRSHLKAPLSTFLFGWILYCLLRFSVEFLRDPATNHGLGNAVSGMKALQWLLLGTALFFGIILFIRESTRKKHPIAFIPDVPGNTRIISLLVFLLLMSLWMGRLFGIVEKLMLNSALIISFLLAGWKLFCDYTTPGYRIATITGILAAFVLMGQSYFPKSNDQKVTYTEIGGGVQIGRFYNTVVSNMGKYSFQSINCDGDTITDYNTRYLNNNIKNSSVIGGLSIARGENLSYYIRKKYGINFSFGSDLGRGIDSVYTKTMPVVTAQPFFSYDGRMIGFSVGVNVGLLHFANMLTENNLLNEGDISNEVKNVFFYPSLKFRVGPYDLIYAESFIGDNFPSAIPLMQYGISIGSGLGKVNGTNISLGATSHLRFLKASLPIKENYLFDAFYGRSSSEYSNTKTNQFSISMHYRFNYKTAPVAHTLKAAQK